MKWFLMIKKYSLGKLENEHFFLEISKEMRESLSELSQAFKENKILSILSAIKKYSTLMIEMDNKKWNEKIKNNFTTSDYFSMSN